MLNKLLKRCMPWMDKGRWYKLVLVGNGNDFEIVTNESDRIFSGSSVQIVDNKIYILNSGIMFIDVKALYEFGPMVGAPTYGCMSDTTTATLECTVTGVTPGAAEGAKLTFLIFGR